MAALQKVAGRLQRFLSRDEPSPLPVKPYHLIHDKDIDGFPPVSLTKLDKTVICGCTGPGEGLTRLELHSDGVSPPVHVPGVCSAWNNASHDSLYGISLSLYEEVHHTNGDVIGDPVADVYGGVVRGNNTILAVADGVSWGKKPRLAARCAVRGAIEHVSNNIDRINGNPNSSTVFRLLKNSLMASQDCIISNSATLTTLSVVIVCPLAPYLGDNVGAEQYWGVFTACVGDSPVFVYSTRTQSIIELTTGSNPSNGVRNTRNSGGSLGPAIGSEPDLSNLSYSLVLIMTGDVILLMTDGISDNFIDKENKDHSTVTKNLETVIKCHQDRSPDTFSAQSVAALLMNRAVELTEAKRQFNCRCFAEGIEIKARAREDKDFADIVNSLSGKLDHATILTHQITELQPDS